MAEKLMQIFKLLSSTGFYEAVSRKKNFSTFEYGFNAGTLAYYMRGCALKKNDFLFVVNMFLDFIMILVIAP